MRRLLLIVLCAVLPWPAGLATARALAKPCPMHAVMLEALPDAEAADAALPDCCHDAQTFAKTGQACKPVPALQLPLAVVMEAPMGATQIVSAPRPAAPRPWPPPDDIAATPWRPPAAD